VEEVVVPYQLESVYECLFGYFLLECLAENMIQRSYSAQGCQQGDEMEVAKNVVLQRLLEQ
jgi:hypothetical protein